MSAEFCPRCGTPRVGSFRFCRSCQFDFDLPSGGPQPPNGRSFSDRYAGTPFGKPLEPAPPAGAPEPEVRASAPLNIAFMAGLAWLAAAAAMGWLGLLQIGYGDDLTGLGVMNAASAVLTAYFGLRCLTGPRRGFLQLLVVWAIVNALWGAYQVSQGATHSAFIAAIVCTGLAGVLSLAAIGTARLK